MSKANIRSPKGWGGGRLMIFRACWKILKSLVFELFDFVYLILRIFGRFRQLTWLLVWGLHCPAPQPLWQQKPRGSGQWCTRAAGWNAQGRIWPGLDSEEMFSFSYEYHESGSQRTFSKDFFWNEKKYLYERNIQGFPLKHKKLTSGTKLRSPSLGVPGNQPGPWVV